MHPDIFIRNMPTISKKEQALLSRSCVAIAGLGGVGGIAFELLVRAGVGSIIACDADKFDVTNANRQTLCTAATVGKKKTLVALSHAKKINPKCKIIAISGFAERNFARIFSHKPAVVLDCMDNFASRQALSIACKKAGVSLVFASAAGSRGMCGVLESKSYADVFGRKKFPLGCESILGPVSNTAGCLASMQAICILLNKPHVRAPTYLFIDAFSEEPVRMLRI